MKKAFTLIEVIISIMIFSLVATLLYKSVASLKLNNKNYKNTIDSNKNISKVIQLIKKDILLAKQIDIKSLDKDTLKIITTNSIHNIAKPTITWKILPDSHTLIRVEEINDIKYIDNTTLKCDKIKVYYSKKEHKVLFYIKTLQKKEFFFETLTSY